MEKTLTETTASAQAKASPLETLNSLTSSDWRILDELLYLQERFQIRNPSKAPYCVPGQAYLADKVGITREHASRRTSAMAALGILRKITRRKAHGRWSTCLYIVTSSLKWRINRLLTRLRTRSNRVINTSHIARSFIKSSSNLTPLASILGAIAPRKSYDPPPGAG